MRPAMHRFHRKTERRAFTLIELLVVIAIISIIAAIIFPVFASARERARQAACLSNLKQIGLATTMYVQDYDETFFDTPEPGGIPPADLSNPNANGGCSVAPCSGTEFWTDLLMPYVKDTHVYSCLSNSDTLYGTDNYCGPATPAGSAGCGSSGPNQFLWTNPHAYRVTYGFSDYGPLADASDGAWNLARISGPAEVALFADADLTWNTPTCEPDPADPGGYALYYAEGGAGWTQFGPPRHFGGMNFAYADGHAKWGQPVATLDPSDPVWAFQYYPTGRVNSDDYPLSFCTAPQNGLW